MQQPYSLAIDFLVELADLLKMVSPQALDQTLALLLDARATGARVYVIGNGGSAATASHFVCDLSKTALVEGHRPLRAFALSDNGALVTAWANDVAYERIFAEQIHGLVDPGDIVIAISASGNSPNVVAGLHAAAERGARTVGLLGYDGGAALGLVDVAIHVPVADYGLVEAAHLTIAHAVTKGLRAALEARSSGDAQAASGVVAAS